MNDKQASNGLTYEACLARTRTGGHCRKPAGWGTDHVGYGSCRLHGGTLRSHRVKWAKVIAHHAATEAVAALDLTHLVGVPPEEALLMEVARCHRMVSFISHQINTLEHDEIAGLMVTKVTDANGVERTVSSNIWVRMLGEWSDRLTRTSKAALDAGVEERQVRVAELQAAMLADVMRAVLEDLGHDYTDPNVGRVVAARLRELPVGA